jgi:hypothetical protein
VGDQDIQAPTNVVRIVLANVEPRVHVEWHCPGAGHCVRERDDDALLVGLDRHARLDLIGDRGRAALVVGAHDHMRIGLPGLEQDQCIADLGEHAAVHSVLDRVQDDGPVREDRVGGVAPELAHDNVPMPALEQRAEVQEAPQLVVVLEGEGSVQSMTLGRDHRGVSGRSGCPRVAGQRSAGTGWCRRSAGIRRPPGRRAGQQ